MDEFNNNYTPAPRGDDNSMDTQPQQAEAQNMQPGQDAQTAQEPQTQYTRSEPTAQEPQAAPQYEEPRTPYQTPVQHPDYQPPHADQTYYSAPQPLQDYNDVCPVSLPPVPSPIRYRFLRSNGWYIPF